MKAIFSNLEQVKLDWLKNLLLVFGTIWVTALLRFVTAYGKVGCENKVFVPLLLCVTIFLIGWYALRQPEIFSDRWDTLIREHDRNSMNVESESKEKILQEPSESFKQRPQRKYSSLPEQDLARHKKNLINYLEREKPYTDNDLKIQDLASHLSIQTYQLSQIINREFHRNFYDLINSYRIEEAKRRLTDPANQHLTILAIAYDVGFNSKSVFNTAFKKYTNMTPSQYKKSQLTVAHS